MKLSWEKPGLRASGWVSSSIFWQVTSSPLKCSSFCVDVCTSRRVGSRHTLWGSWNQPDVPGSENDWISWHGFLVSAPRDHAAPISAVVATNAPLEALKAVLRHMRGSAEPVRASQGPLGPVGELLAAMARSLLPKALQRSPIVASRAAMTRLHTLAFLFLVRVLRVAHRS